MYQSYSDYHHDEKASTLGRQVRTQRRRLSTRERFIRHFIPSILLLGAAFLLFRKTLVTEHRYDAAKYLNAELEDDWVMVDKNDTSKVALEAHIMSKCPDAMACLQKLVVPAMEKVSDKVDFRLSYIGSLDPHSDEVHCMHGPGECLGNIIQLCAQKIYPEAKIFLGFANCMISDYPHIPDRDLIESCAMEHSVDFGRINRCISEEGNGMDLLRASVERSKANHVSKSCTVRLDGKVRCIHDGGEWYDCPGGSEVSDLVHDIEALYEEQSMR